MELRFHQFPFVIFTVLVVLFSTFMSGAGVGIVTVLFEGSSTLGFTSPFAFQENL